MDRGTMRRYVDTAPLGLRERMTPGSEPGVWPWYALGSALFALAIIVAHVDVRADAHAITIAAPRLASIEVPAPPRLDPGKVSESGEAAGAHAIDARDEPDPLTARSLNSLGFAARKKGDHASARLLYREAMAVDARHVWSRFNLACELALQGDEAGALALLEEVARIGGPDADKALGEHAPRDKDLGALSRNPRFHELTRDR